METVKIGVIPFSLSLAAVLVAELALSYLVSADIIPKLPALGFARLFEITLFLLIFSSFDGLAAIGLARWQLKDGLKRGLIWSAGFAFVTAAGFGILFALGKNPFALIHAGLPGQTHKLVLFLILAGLIGPVAEEIFFRGVLYGFIRQTCVAGAFRFFEKAGPGRNSPRKVIRAGVLVAIVICVIAFVAVHPVAGFPQIVGGTLMTVAYEIEGKLMAPITVHVLGNTAIHALSLVQ